MNFNRVFSYMICLVLAAISLAFGSEETTAVWCAAAVIIASMGFRDK